jgi:Prokaryotic Cytochrome C oxidase subunit IV
MNQRRPSFQKMSTETAIWLALLLITCVSWALSAHHHAIAKDPFSITAFLIVLAFFKVRLVLLYFMEVRQGPWTLRISCEAWILFSCIGTLAYLGDFLSL